VKRSRQLGQQPWVMTDPSIRSPRGQCTAPLARPPGPPRGRPRAPGAERVTCLGPGWGRH
jgi:hypothetical protein